MGQKNQKLAGLIETLTLLITQGRAYDRALPPDNFHARAAVALMSALAEQALTEAQDLAIEDEPGQSQVLSGREMQVLRLVAQGLTNKETAYRLGLSARTVQYHLNSIFNKTGTSSRSEAVAVAYQRKWLS
jgi:DNA-binding CsgD family transcriptional regulator